MDVDNRRRRARARDRAGAKCVDAVAGVDAGAIAGVDAGVIDRWNHLPPGRQMIVNKIRVEMDVNNRRSRARARALARARCHAKWVDAVDGVDAGVIDSAYKWNQLPPGRQMIVNKIMETLHRYLPGSPQEGLQELMKIAVMFEEKTYTAATSQQDYLQQISLKMLTLENKSQNPMSNYLHLNAASIDQNVHGQNPMANYLHPNAASSGQNVHDQNPLTNYYYPDAANSGQSVHGQNPMTNYLHPNAASSGQNVHGPEMTMEATSYKTTSGPEESDEEQAAEEEEDAGDMSKEDVVEEVVVSKEQNCVVGHKENVTVRENEMSCRLSSGAKLDERLAQVEERLQKMEARSEKVETFLADINKKLNYLMKMQDAKVSRDIKRPTKYMSSSWTGNGRSKRKHRVAEMIRQSCKHRRLGRGDKAIVHPVASRDDCVENCVENDQRKLDNEEPTI